MFNAFEGSPRIVRLWGRGRILERESAEFRTFVEKNGIQTIPATRSIILVDVHQVGSSCGYSVPFFEFRDFRKTLNQVFEKREKDLLAGDEDKTMDRYVFPSLNFRMAALAPSAAWRDLCGADGAADIGRTRTRGASMVFLVCVVVRPPVWSRKLLLSKRWYAKSFSSWSSDESDDRLTSTQIGPLAPIDAHGPGSSSIDARLRYYLATLRRTQFNVASTAFIASIMFLLGVAVALYGPLILEKVVQQRQQSSHL
jgi:hypothetical protein